MAEVRVCRTGGKDEVVVGKVAFLDLHRAVGDVGAVDLAEHDLEVLLAAKNGADGGADLGGRQRGGGDLIEQGLKDVVVAAVDEGHVDRGFGQCFGGRQPGEAAADDDDLGESVRVHAWSCWSGGSDP